MSTGRQFCGYEIAPKKMPGLAPLWVIVPLPAKQGGLVPKPLSMRVSALPGVRSQSDACWYSGVGSCRLLVAQRGSVGRCGSLAEVRVQEGEPLENALRRFKRKVQQEDIIKEVKRHSFYLKPGEKRRVKEALARKRNRKKARKEQD